MSQVLELNKVLAIRKKLDNPLNIWELITKHGVTRDAVKNIRELQIELIKNKKLLKSRQQAIKEGGVVRREQVEELEEEIIRKENRIKELKDNLPNKKKQIDRLESDKVNLLSSRQGKKESIQERIERKDKQTGNLLNDLTNL